MAEIGRDQASAREREGKIERESERPVIRGADPNGMAGCWKQVCTNTTPTLVISRPMYLPIEAEPAYLITAAIDTVVCRAGNYGRTLLPSAVCLVRVGQKEVQLY